MKVNDYVRTDIGIGKYISNNEIQFRDGKGKATYRDIIKSSANILKLLEPMDLLYVDIDGGFEGGIIVPRIPETQNELNEFIEFIKSGQWILKGVVTHEQLKSRVYEVK